MKILIILSVGLLALGVSALTCNTTSTTTKAPVSDKDIYNKNKYTVLASRFVRIAKPFRVFVQAVEVAFEFEIKLLLASDDNKFHVEKAIKLSPNVLSKTVEFDTSTFPFTSNYSSFTVSSALYKETKYISIANRDSALVFQTNKGIYKPDDLIKFRIYSVDSETNAVNPIGPVEVKLYDPNNNVMAKFTNLTFINGKYEGQWLLSSKPPSGNWKFICQNKDEWPMESDFKVDDYVFFLFNASLTVPHRVSYSSTKFPITINAEYYFKQPVHGIATITITKYYSEVFVKNFTCTAKSTTIFIDFVTELGYTDSTQNYEGKISLVFTDLKTNIQDFDESYVYVVPYMYNLEFVNNHYYQPGSNFTFTVVVKTLDGKPAPNVQVLVKYGDYSPLSETTLTTGSDGTISKTFKTILPLIISYDVSVNLQASCAQCSSGAITGSSPMGHTPNAQQGINLEVFKHEPSFTETVDIIATFAEKIDQFYVFIASKGVLLESRKIVVNGKQTQFSIKPDFIHAPLMQIYAYYYKKSEAKFYETTLLEYFEDELPNYVKLGLQGADATGNVIVKPGSNISLTVSSKPSSIVSLVAIDQRVLNTVKNTPDIGHYLSFGNMYYFEESAKQCSVCQNDPYSVANNANMFFFTNVNVNDLSTPAPGQSAPSMAQASPPAASTTTSSKTRTDFSETWLWEDVTVGSSSVVISRKVPDGLGTYVIFGVAMSKTNGLGVTDVKPSTTIFLPFFISLEIPPTIKRGELLPLEIKVFNYLGSNQTATLTVTKDAMFDASDFTTEGRTSTSTAYTKQIKVANNDFTTTILTIKPKTIGVINIKVSVTTAIAGDAIQKPIRVIFEGVLRSITTSTLVFVNSTLPQADKLLKCSLPEAAISDSIEISAIVVGAILGRAMNNLERLIDISYGCPEQVMVRFVPDYTVLKYLEAVGSLTVELKTKLLQYLSTGYTNLMVNQGADGSFKGSTWLTAYIAHYLQLISQYITVDATAVEKALNFTISKQNIDGSFNEIRGYYSYQLQSGASKGVALCGYLVVVLTELAKSYPVAVAPRNLAVEYLEQQLSLISETFALAIVAYALQLGNSPSAKNAYNLLFARKIDDKDGKEIYWSVPLPTNVNDYNLTRSYNIETTAYALLVHMARGGDSITAFKIARYLIGQGNAYGGYTSSQDTVISLIALSKFASLNTLSQEKVNLKLTPNVGTALTAQLTAANMFSLQNFNLNSATKQLNVHVEANSTGIAVVSLVCKYFEDPAKAFSSYDITYDFNNSCKWRIQMKICVRLLTEETNNMATMEIRMPTGYTGFETNWTPDVSGISLIEKFEDNTIWVLHVEITTTNGACTTIYLIKQYNVRNVKPGSIVVNDFYDTAIQGSASFSIPASIFNITLCS